MKLFRRPENTQRMTRMAKAVGVDLAARPAEGDLSAQELRLAANRCGECCGERECSLWLQSREDHAAAAPRFCPNHALYASLKEGC